MMDNETQNSGYQINCFTESDLIALGKNLGESLSGGEIIFLEGALGAGKTTLTRGILAAYGHEAPVKSPTYTLVEPYLLGGQQFYHFDLYRLGDPEELEYIGIRDYFDFQAVSIFEWPTRGNGIIPKPDLSVHIVVQTNLSRQLTLFTHTDTGIQLLKKLKGQIDGL